MSILFYLFVINSEDHCLSFITPENITFNSGSLTIRLGFVKNYYATRTISNINETVYKTVQLYCNNSLSNETFLKLTRHQRTLMATFFRSIFQNKDLNLIPHAIKSANINIYVCILLNIYNIIKYALN